MFLVVSREMALPGNEDFSYHGLVSDLGGLVRATELCVVSGCCNVEA